MLRTACVGLLVAAFLVPTAGCTDPQALDGLVIMLPPTTPDNVNVSPIILQRPSAARLKFTWVWERDGVLYSESDKNDEIFPLSAFETFPDEEWTITVTPVAGLEEGPSATATTTVSDAGRDSDNDRDGWTENAGDCDDTDPRLFPFSDNDSDGFDGCANPFGFDGRDPDCDDYDRFTNPGVFIDDTAREDEDNDCDGMIDEDAHDAGDIAIVEVLSDPTEQDAGWIELVSLSDLPIELGGWTIAGLDVTGVVPDARLEPGERTLLCNDPDAVPDLECLNANELDFPLSDGLIQLLTHDVIASVALSELPTDEGTSTQLSASVIIGSDAMSEPDNWCLATETWDDGDRGSPGQPNEVYP